MSDFSALAACKVNLFLHVLGKRADGYHRLQSLVVFGQFGDRLHFSPANMLTLKLAGPEAGALDAQLNSNLVMRAAGELRLRSGGQQGAAITLEKNIPIGAGLGGGSADAAATLTSLCRMWKAWEMRESLPKLALGLGADVPVCLASTPCLVEGVGEVLKPVALKAQFWLVLINPRQMLPTADVFKAYQGSFRAAQPFPTHIEGYDALLAAIRPCGNDLQQAAMQKVPAIGQQLQALEATDGCDLARMSGSGATCFGIYRTEALAQAACEKLRRMFPDWWCVATPHLEAGHGKTQ